MDKNKKVLFGVVAAIALLCVVVALVVHRGGQTEKDKDVIKIGVIFPLTGPAANAGESAQKGLLIQNEIINQNGGIHGKKVQLIIEDAAFDAKKARDAYRKLKDMDKVSYFITCLPIICSNVAEEVKEDDGSSLLVCTITAIKELPKMSKWIFRINDDVDFEIFYLSKLFFVDKKCTRPVFYVCNEDACLDSLRLYTDEMKKAGLSSLKTLYYDIGQSDHRNSIEQLKALNPDVCFFLGNEETGARALRQAKQSGLDCYYVARTALASSPVNIELAGEGAEDLYSVTIKSTFEEFDDEMRKEFRTSYVTKYNEQPNLYSFYAASALQMLTNGMINS